MINSPLKISTKHLNWLSLKTSFYNIIDNHLDIDSIPASEINRFLKNLQQEFFTAATTSQRNFKDRQYHPHNKKKRKNAIWWTRELEIKRSKTRALRRLYQKESNQQIRTIKLASYKKNLVEYKRLILAKKKEKFQEYINSITSSTLFGNNFNIITNKKRRTTMKRPIYNSDGNLTNSIQESTVAILDFHFPWSEEVLHSTTLGAQNDFFPISINETEGIINRNKLNKAVGTDGLPGEIIKEIFFANRQWFTALLNYLLEKGTFPETWKSARIVLLDKENKSLDHPSHFRPICVLPCWKKVFDKLIADKLSYHLEHDQILSNKQFGFRKNRSTILALKEIIDFNSVAKENNHLTCLISIDMSNAFNNVDWNILFGKINLLSIPLYLKNILLDFLHNRTVSYQGVHKKYNKGVPQGSCLGPILWNVFINDLLLKDFGPNSKVQAFADDILMMINAPASYCFTRDSRYALSVIEN
ncbi:uncharacterized protein CDAR_2661 [Caerostris darwini]|uniref:Reverse transcriptase domain-containing protein n=1 Tax=Caerostris darwini TaxID=1538125 RepID=A0AAV4MY61_9ARAC|nr:uncharacterized protein CDAR_2661 [Caerostris darwini]